MKKKKIIIDTDPGIDDAQAIAFALCHPELEVLGLTTVFGNADIDTTTRNASLVLDRFGSHQVPVARGAAEPLSIDPLPHALHVHGQDGIGEIGQETEHNAEIGESAAAFIVRLANEYPGEITLVAVGPLTNVAAALSLDPALPDKLAALVVMGGTVIEPGNVSPVAEANFLNDPHAADQVAGADWPLTIIGLDVTHRVLLTDTHLATLRDQAGATGRFLWESSRFYVDFYSNKGAARDSSARACAMHDALALIYLVQPDRFTVHSGAARVATDGIAMGQLMLDRRGYQYVLPDWQGRPMVHVALTVEAPAALDTFVDILTRHHLT